MHKSFLLFTNLFRIFILMEYKFFLHSTRGVVSADNITKPLRNIATDSSTVTVEFCIEGDVFNVNWIFKESIGNCAQGLCTSNENFTAQHQNSCYMLILHNLNIMNLKDILKSEIQFETSILQSGAYITKIDNLLLSTTNEIEEGSITTLSCSVGYNGAIIPFLSWRMSNGTVLETENNRNMTTVTTRLTISLSRNDSMKQFYCSVKFNSIGDISCGSGVHYCARNIPSYSKDHSGLLPLVRYPPQMAVLIRDGSRLMCRHDGNIADSNVRCSFTFENITHLTDTSCETTQLYPGCYQCSVVYYFHGFWTNLTSNVLHISSESDGAADCKVAVGATVGGLLVFNIITIVATIFIQRHCLYRNARNPNRNNATARRKTWKYF